MNEKIRIRWEVDDGYAGSRPQHAYVTLDDFEHCETEQDVMDEINAILQSEFESRIGFYCKNESEVVAEVMTAIKSRGSV
jgi:hypothetical protein